MRNFSKKRWYVLRVRYRTELLAQLSLKKKQFEILNPTYKTLSIRKDRRKILHLPIFKGYIFVRTLLNPKYHIEILKTPGVVEILKSSNGPTPVPDDQIDNVILLQKYVGNCFHLTEFKIGDSVCVKQGPLTGLRGKIDKLNKNKLYIHVDVIPGSVMVEIDQDHVQLEGDHLYSIVKNI